MAAAEQLALRRGVRCIYVHVVHSNLPALALYTAAGYNVESQESENTARALRRPRRLLLRKELAAAGSA
jgi:ribosomal protein S18 acetylase RimI-like enzyme